MAMLLIIPFEADASSRKTFRGEVSVEQGYESNIDRVPRDAESEHESRVSPRMVYTRDTQTSSFSLSYAPSLVYSYRTKDERVDHQAAASYSIQALKRLGFNFSNTYRLSDDPYTFTEAEEIDGEIELSDRRGRRRYWINSFSSSMNYAYAQESIVSMGYNNRVLRNRDDEYTDYIRHSPFVSIAHRFNHQWSMRSGYTFSRGDFDGDNDITTHSGDVAVHYRLSPHTSIFSRLGYTYNDYEEPFRDYEVYTATVGVDRELSSKRSLDIETGASLVRPDALEYTEAFLLKAALDNELEKGSWRIHAESGLDQRYYDGIDDEGLSRYWLAGIRIRRPLTENVQGSTGATYREDEYIETIASDREKRIRADARLTYNFARWYRLDAGYAYTELDADERRDSYQNHRVFVRLTAGKDLIQW